MAYKHLGPRLDDSALDAEAPPLPDILATPPPEPAQSTAAQSPEPTFDVFEAEDGTLIVELRAPDAESATPSNVPGGVPPAVTKQPESVLSTASATDAALAALLVQQAQETLLRRNLAQVALYARTAAPATQPRGQYIDQKV